MLDKAAFTLGASPAAFLSMDAASSFHLRRDVSRDARGVNPACEL